MANVEFWNANKTVNVKLISDTMVSVMDRMTALIPKYKVMLFVGNLDMGIGPAQINKMLENKGITQFHFDVNLLIF